jgi:hypothetical protein
LTPGEVSLPRLCHHAVDLARGKPIWLNHAEQEAFRSLAELGYLRFRDPQGGQTLCTCLHPALFEFHFYYRWLPEHSHRFRPRRAT